MSDNTQIPGSDNIATDDIAGVKHQRVKITLGADGVSDGDVSVANPMPVAVSNFPTTVSVDNFPAGVVGLTDTELRASAVPVMVPGVAQDATVVALQALNDTMLYMLAAILEKMPRVTGNDQAAVSIEGGTVAAVTNVGSVSDITRIGGKPVSQLPDAISQLGALHLYQNIIVS